MRKKKKKRRCKSEVSVQRTVCRTREPVNLTVWGHAVLIGLVRILHFYNIFVANAKNFPLDTLLIFFFFIFIEMTLCYMPARTHSFKVSAQNINTIVLSVGMRAGGMTS